MLSSRLNAAFPVSSPGVRQTRTVPADTHEDGDGIYEEDDIHGLRSLASEAAMHCCFPEHSGSCGPPITLEARRGNADGAIAIALERVIDTQFFCCVVTGWATVFSLPVAQVQKLAAESEGLRMEKKVAG